METVIRFDDLVEELAQRVEGVLQTGLGLQHAAWAWPAPEDGRAALGNLADAVQHLVLARQALNRASLYKGQRRVP
jgi:hypothetical protein